MKFLPWLLLALLSAAFAYKTLGQPPEKERVLPAIEPALFEEPKSTPELRLPERNALPHSELESDLLRELLAEVRGLRQDLAERSSNPREALTPTLPTEEFARLGRALDRIERGQESLANLRLPAPGFDSSIPLENLAALYNSPLGEEALRAYHLETQQRILDEFGRPAYIGILDGQPYWFYSYGKEGEPESWCLSVYFVQGRVACAEIEEF